MFGRDAHTWSLIHAERAALAADLSKIDDTQWATQSLCDRWTVEEALAHLTAVASIGPMRWYRSVLGARFDFDLHNARRMDEHRGATPAETLHRFDNVVPATAAPPGPAAAWLGEVIVHSQDIRRPLGLPYTPSPELVRPVAEFYARRNFAVDSRSTVDGLRVEASDSTFAAGSGPAVTGTTLELTMVMAGRPAYCDHLDGPGVPILRARLSAPVAD
ncbi:maleylpyruvate isomerase family mycothiol-dependent enzyme [Rhodococcus sp. (in: high G+C Gram-positive bacteria)]|uniref:maleylpyruvate isomerase family mycothiol-dependent enzyme n=1 Tax=Rhodococcus sp. TaxID=1831 RepID=UPI00388F0977